MRGCNRNRLDLGGDLEGERTREPSWLQPRLFIMRETFGRAASRLAGTLALHSRLGMLPNE